MFGSLGVLIYIFCGVLCFRGTFEINLAILVLIWYKINKIIYYLDPITPFQTDVVVDIDIPIFFFGAFQNRYYRFFAKLIRYIGLLHSTRLGSWIKFLGLVFSVDGVWGL